MNPEKTEHTWKNLAQQITEERDAEKIIELAAELIHALDEERKPPQNRNSSNAHVAAPSLPS